jgi:hypothetical protein
LFHYINASSIGLFYLDLDDDFVGRVLLLGLAEDVDRPPGLVGDVRNVEAARLLLANLLDFLEVVLRKLNLLEVLLDAGCGDLCGGGADAAGNLLDSGVLDEEGLANHVVTESLGGVSIC